MSERIYNILFLCTGNSARSILAESILRKDGHRHFRAFSAGSQPKGAVNPLAIRVLRSLDYPTDDLRSKSWEEFAAADAPVMDFVFTVCDNAAGESCPVWPGQPMTAHWGIEDPAETAGTDLAKEAAFVAAFGLVITILAGIRFERAAVPWLVGLYITAAYWFTASTSFANPAVAIARSVTNTFSGIRPVDLPGFIAAELCGAIVALMLMSWLLRAGSEGASIAKEAQL